VPAGTIAARYLVSAADGVYVVEADADGVAVQREGTTSGVAEAMVTFNGAAGTSSPISMACPGCSTSPRRPSAC